ncbi:MAG: HD domain-containing protein [Deltaproteobacteria bacterium]|nr:HD domain-containing protein [Deltaproteobacteria bacterium]
MKSRTITYDAFKDSMVLLGVGLAAAYWAIDAALNFFTYPKGEFLPHLIGADLTEFYTRMIVFCLFVIFGSHVQYTITTRKKAELNLLESYKNLQLAREATILGLAKLSEYRDHDTGMHLERIEEYTNIIAREIARLPKYRTYITQEYIESISASSVLHDIGKVGVPDAILLKEDKLTEDEFNVIKTHPSLGGDALSSIEAKIKGQSFLSIGKEIAYHHHEKWDGSGYPDQLSGDSIPISARIVALTDVYDALTTKRPYKKAFSHAEAVDIITKESGSHFDPDIVNAFLSHQDEFNTIRKQFLAELPET